MLAGAVWGLARQAYLSEAVPLEMRARALSTLGGVQRIGSFIGPFLGAFAMKFLGTDGAYWVHLVAADRWPAACCSACPTSSPYAVGAPPGRWPSSRPAP